MHDVARANLLAATHPALAWGERYQVATGRSITLNEVLDALDAVAPQPVQRRYAAPRTGDILHSAGSSARLQALGWCAQVSLQTGLAQLVESP